MAELRARTKKEAEAYYEKQYPWLSRMILPDAAYRLALDILFEEVKPSHTTTTDAPVARERGTSGSDTLGPGKAGLD